MAPIFLDLKENTSFTFEFYQTYPRDSKNSVLPESLKVLFDDDLLEKLPDSIDSNIFS